MNTFYTSLFLLLLITPLLYVAYKQRTDHSKPSTKYIALFAVVFILYDLLYLLPRAIPSLRIVHGEWNWEAKALALIMAIK